VLRQKLIAIAIALNVALTVRAEPDTAATITVNAGAAAPITLTRFADDEAAIVIDGQLIEAAWTKLPVIHELRVLEPDTLAEPPYATDVRVLYTEKGLYIGVDMEQPADTIVKRFTPRDEFEVDRDYISITLDCKRGHVVPAAEPAIDLGVVDRIEPGIGSVDRVEERQHVHAAEGALQRTTQQCLQVLEGAA
jgi:hypothetical protein